MVIQQLQRLLPLHGFGHGAAGRGVADQGTLQPSHRDLDAEAGPRGERKGLDFLQVEKYQMSLIMGFPDKSIWSIMIIMGEFLV